MKGTRYTDEQIVRILGEVERGRPIAEVCRKYRVAEATVYRWRAKYRGMDRAQLRKLKQLEVENRRLKRIVARKIGHRCPEGSIGKRMVSPSAKRCGVRYLAEERGYSQRRGCSLVELSRTSFGYLPRAREEEARLTERIRELAREHPAYGYRRIRALLLREGSRVNTKRVHRIWKREGLQVPRRKPKKRKVGPKGEVSLKAEKPNQVWTYDFLEDRTEGGKKLRMLTVLDEYSRESLNITVGTSIPADKVIMALDWLFLTRGVPEYIRSDNGPEFVAKAVRSWLRDRGCKTIYITPGSPWENPYIESFHDKLREECLNRYLFVNVQEAQEVVEAWRQEYNRYRPHSSLGYLTPVEYANRGCTKSREVVQTVVAD